MNNNLSLKLTHLYPEEMNIYGDMGNILTLKKRCEWRGIELKIENVGKGKLKNNLDADIYFMGGGQDDDMYGVFEDMLEFKKDQVKKEFENDKVFLLICGAFELFGKYFLDSKNRTIEGLNILPIETKAPGDQLADRCLGNLVYELNKDLKERIEKNYTQNFESTIVGFENHGGQVFFLDKSIKPIGKVLKGKGNNAKEGIEGAVLKNIFGSFTHGSLLPKNPHLADTIISLALKNKYKEEIILKKLDDEIEWNAHKAARSKILNK
jgi:CobQ-like glutamine amidotransferase family enzyme